MARRSLKPQLNQIRTWVRQGRTDAWIAHQLEVTVQQIDTFKRENELAPDAENGRDAAVAGAELDLRAEDDAQIAAELEAEAARRAEEEAVAAGDDDQDDADAEPKPRRRGRRGGRGRGKRSGPVGFEATFDHGEDGYGLWLDPAVADEAVYAEHWSGIRDVVVTIEADQIVIRRAGDDTTGDD